MIRVGHSFRLEGLNLGPGAVPLWMIWIEPGSFRMGSLHSEKGRFEDEGPVQVLISQGFWISRCAITQAQYASVITFSDGNPWPSLFYQLPDSNDRPVETVSWRDANIFIKHLNNLYSCDLPDGYKFALPTESQWEYACRAGTLTRYHSGDSDADLDRVDWHAGNSGGTTHVVGQKPANAWGLCDLHGNVMEWCHDWYAEYPCEVFEDWREPPTGTLRSVRGRSWKISLENGEFRSACRFGYQPEVALPFLGFRISLRRSKKKGT